jgi:hypothetical protein
MGGWHHGSIMDGTHSAAEVNEHVDHMLKHFYVEIDATDAQKAQIGPLPHVRQIARRHGGDAICSTLADGRSGFVVTLPT